MRWVCSLLIIGLAAACTQHNGRLLVVVDTDIDVPAAMNEIGIEVRAGGTGRPITQSFVLIPRGTDAGPPLLGGVFDRVAPPFSFVVTAPSPPQSVDITARGLGPGCSVPPCEIVSQRIRTNFVPGRTAVVRMFLASACRPDALMPRVCGAEERCDRDGCVPISVDATPVTEPFPPGTEFDAAVDAPLLDAPAPDSPTADAPTDGSPPDTGRADAGMPIGETFVIYADGGEAMAHFGTAVALNAAGTLAVIGAPDHNSGRGMAQIWRRGATWVSEGNTLAILDPGEAGLGASVAVAASVDRVLVGSRSGNVARVFTDRLWMQQGVLSTGTLDGVGASVSLAGDTAVALVGAPTLASSGGAYLFQETGTWMRIAPTLTATLIGPAGLGTSAAISEDGATAVLGAPFATPDGRAFVLDDPGWSAVELPAPMGSGAFGRGCAVSARGDHVIVSGNPTVAVFERASSWTPTPITLSATMAGTFPAVAIDGAGTRILVSSPDNGGMPDLATGYVAVLQRTSTGWARIRELRPTVEHDGDAFGQAVAISGDGQWALVGAPADDTAAGVDAGSVYVFFLGP